MLHFAYNNSSVAFAVSHFDVLSAASHFFHLEEQLEMEGNGALQHHDKTAQNPDKSVP